MAKAPELDQDASPQRGVGILSIVIVAIAALGSAFGVSFVLGSSNKSHMPPQGDAALHEEKAAPPREEILHKVLVELPEILISIGGPPTERYLKMSVVVSTHKQGTKLVEANEPLLMDAFIGYLRAIEVGRFEDPLFFPMMRDQLSHRSKLVLGAENSGGVFVTEFLLR